MSVFTGKLYSEINGVLIILRFCTKICSFDNGRYTFLYRHSPMKGFHKITCQKRIENFLLENQGFVALYGETELSIEEFYLMFEDAKNNYDRIRKKYDCENAFPHVYTKISKLGRN